MDHGTHPFPDTGHDHAGCVARGMAAAERICARSGRRLTPDRRQVLEILLGAHAALSAYDIVARMDWQGRKPGSYAVYRALDVLEQLGLIHRIRSRNAFFACTAPDSAHGGFFFICTGCDRIGEVTAPAIEHALADAAQGLGFTVERPMVEIDGLCPHCVGTA